MRYFLRLRVLRGFCVFLQFQISRKRTRIDTVYSLNITLFQKFLSFHKETIGRATLFIELCLIHFVAIEENTVPSNTRQITV